jgi:hypothetical protein
MMLCMALPSLFPHITPRGALAAQAAIIAMAIAVAEFTPRPGLATLYLPLAPARQHPALEAALAQGSYIMGTGPAGGLILGGAQPGLVLQAAREGALAVAVPSFLCRQPDS